MCKDEPTVGGSWEVSSTLTGCSTGQRLTGPQGTCSLQHQGSSEMAEEFQEEDPPEAPKSLHYPTAIIHPVTQ